MKQSALDQAEDLLARGGREEAINLLRAAAEGASDPFPIHLRLGQVFFVAGMYPEALAEFDRAAEGPRPNADVHRKIGEVRLQLGDAAGAEASYRQAISLDPSDKNATDALAHLLWECGRVDDAKAARRPYLEVVSARIAKTQPASWATMQNAQSALFSATDGAETLEIMRSWVDRWPGNVFVHAALIVALRTRGAGQKALREAYENLRPLLQNPTPEILAAATRIATELMNGKLEKEGEEILLGLIDAFPEDIGLHLQLALKKERVGDKEGARSFSRRHAELLTAKTFEAPSLFRPDVMNMVNSWLRADEPEAAVAAGRRILDRFPGNSGAQLCYAAALAGAKDAEGLRTLVASVLETMSQQAVTAHGPDYRLIADALATACSQDEAIAFLEKVGEVAPDVAETFNKLAHLHGDGNPRRKDAFRRAARAFAKAIEMPRPWATGAERAIQSWLSAGDWEQGLALALALVAEHPDRPNVHLWALRCLAAIPEATDLQDAWRRYQPRLSALTIPFSGSIPDLMQKMRQLRLNREAYEYLRIIEPLIVPTPDFYAQGATLCQQLGESDGETEFYEKKIDLLKKMVKSNNGQPSSQDVEIVSDLLSRNREKEAVAVAVEAWERNPEALDALLPVFRVLQVVVDEKLFERAWSQFSSKLTSLKASDYQSAKKILKLLLDTSPCRVDRLREIISYLITVAPNDDEVYSYASTMCNKIGDSKGERENAKQEADIIQASWNPGMEGWLSKAKKLTRALMIAGEMPAAKRIVADVLKYHKDNIQACLFAMDFYSNEMNVDVADEIWDVLKDHLETNNNWSIPALHRAAKFFQEMNQFERALLLTDKQLDLRKDGAELYKNRGICLKELGRNDEANDSFRMEAECVTSLLKGDYYDKRKWAREVFMLWNKLGESKRAFDELRAFRDSHRQNVSVNCMYILALLERPNPVELDEALEGLLSCERGTDAKGLDEVIALSSTLVSLIPQSENVSRLIEWLESELGDEPQVMQIKAGVSRQRGNSDEAARLLRKRAEILTDMAVSSQWRRPYIRTLIQAWLEAEDSQSAYREARRYIDCHPGQPESYNMLLQLLADTEGDREYLQLLNDLWDKWPGNRLIGSRLIKYHVSRGNNERAAVYQASIAPPNSQHPSFLITDTKNLPENEAHDKLRGYFDEYKNRPDLLRKVYECQNAVRDGLGARRTAERLVEIYQEAVNLDGSNFETRYMLGMYQQVLGENDRALENLRRAVELKPDDVKALGRLFGQVTGFGGGDENAIALLDNAAREHQHLRAAESLCHLYAHALHRLGNKSGGTALLVPALMLLSRFPRGNLHNSRHQMATMALDLFDRLNDPEERQALAKAVAEPVFLPWMAMIDPEEAREQAREWLDAYESGRSPALHLSLAVDYLKRALSLTAEDSVIRQTYTSELARLLFRMVQVDPTPDVVAGVITLCRDMIDRGEESYLREAMLESGAAIRGLFQRDRWEDVVALANVVGEIGDRLRNLLPSWGQRETWLSTTQENFSNAAYALYRLGRPEEAVAAHERGLATLMRDELALRDLELDHLRRAVAERRREEDGPRLEDALATFETARLEWARCWEERLGNRVGDGEANRTSLGAMRDVRDQLARSVEELRQCPGLHGFLAPPGYGEIRSAAMEGPLVYILYSSKGGVVFIVGKSLKTIALPSLTTSAVSAKINTYLFHYRRYRAALAAAETDPAPSAEHETRRTLVRWLREMDQCLAWLWDTAIGRLVRELKSLDARQATIVGGGQLRVLPLAAAHTSSRFARFVFFLRHGKHPPPLASPRRSYAIESVCFGTAASAFALETARRARASTRSSERLIGFRWLSTGYAGFDREMKAALQCYPPPHHEVAAPDPRHPDSKADFLSLLDGGSASVLQFSGHGKSDLDDPLNKAGLLVGLNGGAEDWLTVKEILLHPIALRACVLSACESGLESKRDIPHEAIGLPAALVHSGVAAVVAPLWTVSNRATSEIVSRFHQNWPSSDSPARALREAQLWLRSASWRDSGERDGPNFVSRTMARAGDIRDMDGPFPVPVAPREHSGPGPFDDVPTDHPFFWAAFVCTGA
ncbi:CHAT domain-containing protein [Rhodospirillum sp. A1_3_36]|uniref:CHAT domain-containing protein n=1 Tax=Rhodospirillum sp. A1_3_36 TaxID=3391666 RepID=UPI0039A45AF3